MSCTTCNRFQGKWPIGKRAERQYHTRHDVRDFIAPQVAWSDFVGSAKSCYVCQILLKGCRGVLEQHEILESNVLCLDVRFFYPAHTEDVDTADSGKHLILQLADGKPFEIELFATLDEDSEIPNAWDYVAVSKRTSPRTDSAAAMTVINDWITECTTEHAEILCSSAEITALPKRVIDVGSNNNSVRLVETNGANDIYICLSHCWGLEQIITTTTATMQDRRNHIAWDDLSQTFQDAITLTRAMSFRYIWIDSLCIIQDSASDWAVESAKMASIYNNGFLTIAGTKSANGRGGLFSPTPDIRVAGTTPEGEKYSIFFRERIDHHIDNILESAGMISSERYYPLLSRAWVYQERMLSTRVLHFGRYEVFFECKSAVQCECDSIRFHGGGTETPIPLIKIEYADALADYSEGYDGAALANVQYQGARMWRSMVSCYTALKLTKSKDRLPAFGGLARQMAAHRRTRYVAGLWEDSLSNDLLWEVYTTSKLKTVRPEPRNAPTWSWASIESAAGVGYLDDIGFTDLDEDEGAMVESVPCEHFSTVEGCDVVVDTVDEFGLVRSGKLKIKGMVVEGVLGSAKSNGYGKVEHSIAFGDSTLCMQSDYFLDEEGPNQTPAGTNVLCLCMSVVRVGQKECLFSLVLKQAPSKPDCYERIGALKITGEIGSMFPGNTIFQKGETRTVVII
ncbi:HET-domain-containing protein [Phaeosphaeriaceae sp. SRC1lsM3a]|nr:HET-domain-containing protein [Stagonospora sp. SRC1lsM3a]